MNKIILTASIATVLTLTLSCSSGGDSDGGGSVYSEVYTLKSVSADQFTYIEEYEEDRCEEGGTLKTEKYTEDNTVNYSIKNNVMTWESRRSDDTLNFKGSSNELIGTWTRTKDKNASCELHTERYCEDYDNDNDVCKRYEEDTYYECKSGWRLTEVVFTERTVKITEDYCRTETYIESTDSKGWRMKVIDCDTYELSKGSEKVTITRARTSRSISYKGKTCTRYVASKAQKQAACKEAWNKYKNDWDEDYYYDFIYKDYNDCVKSLRLPSDL